METDLRRAATWLAGHGAPEATPSPLIPARLRPRRRNTAPLFTVLVFIPVFVGLVARPGLRVGDGVRVDR
jgi:hypothetical protein